jgi:hypothetical protein
VRPRTWLCGGWGVRLKGVPWRRTEGAVQKASYVAQRATTGRGIDMCVRQSCLAQSSRDGTRAWARRVVPCHPLNCVRPAARTTQPMMDARVAAARCVAARVAPAVTCCEGELSSVRREGVRAGSRAAGHGTLSARLRPPLHKFACHEGWKGGSPSCCNASRSASCLLHARAIPGLDACAAPGPAPLALRRRGAAWHLRIRAAVVTAGLGRVPRRPARTATRPLQRGDARARRCARTRRRHVAPRGAVHRRR